MSGRVLGAALCLIAVIVAGCNKDKTVGPKPSEITGSWNATKIQYVNRADPSVSVEVIAAGGSGQLLLNSTKSFRLIVTEHGAAPDTTTGAWNLNGDQMQCEPDGFGYYWVFDVAFSANSLALSGASITYDFQHSGQPTAAEFNLELVR